MFEQELVVDHQNGSYSIRFGSSFNPDALRAIVADRQVCVVTNDTVAPLYLNEFTESLGSVPLVHVLPDGEQYKIVDHWLGILNTLIENRYHRDCVIIALGGGVVGDLAGFAAATYQRGVDYIQVPTTLLSQVDSSIGGKTGINQATFKNMVGAFWQPQLVVINTRVLETLPEREYCAGFAEIIKAALISDPGLFECLESEAARLLRHDSSLLLEVIERACCVKKEIVQRDEREQNGERALLNLGHTFAHAIESYMGSGVWLHGEAVGLGLVLAASFAEEQGLCESKLTERVAHLVGAYRLPTSLPSGTNCAKLSTAMMLDKKVQRGALRMVLPYSVGRCELTSNYSIDTIQAFLENFQRSK
jgi:3-dehydroquinate synthase